MNTGITRCFIGMEILRAVILYSKICPIAGPGFGIAKIMLNEGCLW